MTHEYCWTDLAGRIYRRIALRALAVGMVLVLAVWGGCQTATPRRAVVAPPARLGADGLSRTRIRHEIWVRRTEGGEGSAKAGGYRIRLRRALDYTVRSRRELGSRGFSIYESPLAPVRRLRALMGGRLLPGRHIKRETVSARHIFIDDAKVHRIRYPISRLGTTIGYRYELGFRDPALLPPVVVPEMDHLQRFELVVHHPTDMRVDFQVWRPHHKPAPVIYRSGDSSRWVLQNLRRRPTLPYFSFNGLAALVLPVLKTGTGTLQPIDPVRHARWYRALFRAEPPLSAPHKALVRRLVARATSPLAKVRALHEFVRRKIRYIAVAKGMGRLIPSAAEAVLTRRWGDCKDMANLLRVLGQEAGVKIDLVLVSTRERPSLGATIHTFQYDHLIASYNHGGVRVFFDPTASDVPFGQLPEGDIGARALIVDDRNAVALRLPSPAQSPTWDMKIMANSGQLDRATIQLIVRNNLLGLVRMMIRKMAPTPLQIRLRRVLESGARGLVLRQIQLVSLHDNEAIFRGQADLRGMVVQTRRGLYLPRAVFDPYNDLLQIRAADRLPLMFSARPHLRLTLRMNTPGFTVPTEGIGPLHLNEPTVARFHAQFARTPKGFVATYGLRQFRKHFTGSDRRRMLEFHRRLQIAHSQWIRLSRGGS